VPDVVSFGPFELDTRTGDLRKRGKRIRLAPQPASLLTLLATRPGQLVTRDVIRRHLWGGGVVVEYERSLNACLAHLRATLGDCAEAPRCIETSPRRGYRFIAPVERRRPFPQPTVAVLPFVNLTSDPALEYFVAGLTNELITELASISALRVISYQSVVHLKGSSRTLPEIGSELGADALVEGSAFCEADRVRLNVQLVSASPERHLWAKAYECGKGEVFAFHRQVARVCAGLLSRHDVERGAQRRSSWPLRGGHRPRSNLRAGIRRHRTHVVPTRILGPPPSEADADA
jgi:TolB-like protein